MTPAQLKLEWQKGVAEGDLTGEWESLTMVERLTFTQMAAVLEFVGMLAARLDTTITLERQDISDVANNWIDAQLEPPRQLH